MPMVPAVKAERGHEAAPEDADGPRPGPPSDAYAAPGARLRVLREARGMDLEDLARELNLKPRVLMALEADDYGKLPGPTFVRGYIRSCARQLGTDPEPLLEEFETLAGRVEPVVRPSPRLGATRLDRVLVQRRPGLVMAAGSVAMLALVAAVLMLWSGSGDDARTAQERAPDESLAEAPARIPSQRPASAASAGEEGAAVADVPGADVYANTGANADAVPDTGQRAEAVANGFADAGTGAFDAAGGTAGARAGSDAAPGAGPITAPPSPSAQRDSEGDATAAGAAEENAVQVVAGGEDHLRFVFSGDCWVEVRDADDVAVHQDLARAGQTLDLWGQAPFRIRLGYAPAVELAYNDARVPLTPHTRNDVANLVIGR